MLFSRFIFVSSALFAGSAAAFSVQPSSAMPKTALYASSSDNEGVVDRRQVFASIAATAAAFGASSAYALDIKGNAQEIERNTGAGDKITSKVKSDVDTVSGNKNPFSGGNNMSNNMGMGNNMDMNNAANKAKSVADNLNPFSGNNNMGNNMGKNMDMGKNMGNNMAMGGGNNGNMKNDNYGKGLSNSLGLNNNNMDMGNVADKAKSAMGNNMGMDNAANKVKSAANNLNPFSGGNNMSKNMGMTSNNMSMGMEGNNAADRIKDKAQQIGKNAGNNNNMGQGMGMGNTKGDDYGKGLKNSFGLGNVSQNEKKDIKQLATGSKQFPSGNK